MRFFLDTESGAGLEGDDIKLKTTASYIEVEYSIEDVFLVLYFIPRSSTSFFIATCWDDLFDSILGQVEDESDLETIVETWPSLAQLLANGIDDKYSGGALIKLEDADTGEPKWFVTSVAGNLDLEREDGLFNERTAEVSQLVLAKSLELFTQLQENKPSMLRAMGRGLAAGVGAVLLGAVSVFFGGDVGDA